MFKKLKNFTKRSKIEVLSKTFKQKSVNQLTYPIVKKNWLEKYS